MSKVGHSSKPYYSSLPLPPAAHSYSSLYSIAKPGGHTDAKGVMLTQADQKTI